MGDVEMAPARREVKQNNLSRPNPSGAGVDVRE